MSIGSRIYEIARTPFVFTAQAVDFVVDGVTHIPETYRQSEGSNLTRMTYAPVRSWFESFKDNVAGQASMTNEMTPSDSLFGMVMGPKGIIGATVEAIPEWAGPIPIRKTAGVIWTPFLENMQRVYKYGIDRPIGFIATVDNLFALETQGETEGGGFNVPFGGGSIPLATGPLKWLGLGEADAKITDVPQRLQNMVPGNWQQDDYDAVTLNLDTYKDVWDVTQSRSAGQAIILSQQKIDIFDPVSVQDFEGTLYYQMASGTVDLYLNLAGDPGYVAVKGIKLGYGLRQARMNYAVTGEFRLPPNTVRAPFSLSEWRNKRRNALDRDEAAYQNLGVTPKWLKSPASNASVQEVMTQRPYMDHKQAVQDVLYQTLDEVYPVDDVKPREVRRAGMGYDQTVTKTSRSSELHRLTKAQIREEALIVSRITGDKPPSKATTKAKLVDWVLDREFITIEGSQGLRSGLDELDPVYLTSGEGPVSELAETTIGQVSDAAAVTQRVDRLMIQIGEALDGIQAEFGTWDRDAVIANILEDTPYNTLDDIADALDDLWNRREFDPELEGTRIRPDPDATRWDEFDDPPGLRREPGQMPLDELRELLDTESPITAAFFDDLGQPVTASMNTPNELFEIQRHGYRVIPAASVDRVPALLRYLGMDGAATVNAFARQGLGGKFTDWVERVLELEDARYYDDVGQEFLAAQSRVDVARSEISGHGMNGVI